MGVILALQRIGLLLGLNQIIHEKQRACCHNTKDHQLAITRGPMQHDHRVLGCPKLHPSLCSASLSKWPSSSGSPGLRMRTLPLCHSQPSNHTAEQGSGKKKEEVMLLGKNKFPRSHLRLLISFPWSALCHNHF